MNWREPVILEGHCVRLVPLSLGHVEGLFKIIERETFRFLLSEPEPWSIDGFHQYVSQILAMPDRVPFCILRRPMDEPIGSTSFLDIREEHQSLEIGHTWIAKSFRQTCVNPEIKLLMLGHAFDRLKAIRVQLKTDDRNLQSQRAMEKLGAKREGTLRKHMILANGFVRDTAMYSITDDEWPPVKERLLARLEGSRTT